MDSGAWRATGRGVRVGHDRSDLAHMRVSVKIVLNFLL